MARCRSLLVVVLAGALAVSGQSLQDGLTAFGVQAIFPGASGYAAASKAFNLRYSTQPAAIALPTTPQQVADAVKAGAQAGVRVVARSGGHSYIAGGVGTTNGALVIDLKNLKTITINNSTNQATIGTGNRLGDIVVALNSKGRALPHGTCGYVGIGGHSGHGGFGFTSRMWGLTLDTIVSVQVALANGTLTTASKTVNPDLFWALRGAASSFGITTAVTFQTFAVPTNAIVFQYGWDLNATAGAKAIRSFQTYAATNVPKELGSELVLAKGSAKGKIFVGLTGGWYGAKGAHKAALQSFLSAMPTPQWNEDHGNGTYVDSAKFLSDGSLSTTAPDGTDTFYAKSLLTPTAVPMTENATVAFMTYVANQGFDTPTDWFIQIEMSGGTNSAINAVPLDDTSFGRRNSLFIIQFYATHAVKPFPATSFTFVDTLVSRITSNMPTNWDYGAYVNYPDDRLADWQTRYYGSHYPRLKTLKTALDPLNRFSFPTSVELA